MSDERREADMKNIFCNDHGFTILEVIIAITVLTIGLVSAAAMQTRAMEQSSFANHLSTRVRAGQRHMEDTLMKVRSDDMFSDDVSGLWIEPPEYAMDRSYSTRFRATLNTPEEFLTTVEVDISKRGSFDDEGNVLHFSMIRTNREGWDQN